MKSIIYEARPLAAIIFLFMASNVLLLLSNGVYWDDWVLYNMSYEGIVKTFEGIGMKYLPPIHYWLIKAVANPAQLYHMITIASELFALIAFYFVLVHLKIDRNDIFWLTLILAIAPFNQAKALMVCMPYAVGFCFCMFAMLSFLKYVGGRRIAFRALSLLFFWLSFMVLNSTLVLSLAFISLMAVRLEVTIWAINRNNIRAVAMRLTKWTDFVALPFVFWVFRLLVLMPKGQYAAENYNGLSLSSIALLPVRLAAALVQNLFGLFYEALRAISISFAYAIAFAVLAIILAIALRGIEVVKKENDKQKAMLFVGLYLLLAGAFAYVAVGKIPSFFNYDTRHQILLKVGAPFVVLSLIGIVRSLRIQKYLLVIGASVFIVTNVGWQLQFLKSWFKQAAIEAAIINDVKIDKHTNLVVLDSAKDYNEIENNEYAYYVYTGIFKKIYRDQTRFAIDSSARKPLLEKYAPQDLIREEYNTKDCVGIDRIDGYLIIEHGDIMLSSIQTMRLLYEYYARRTIYESTLGRIIALRILPYSG